MVTEQHHVVPVKVYALIFLALMMGTAVTVGAAIIHLPEPQVTLEGPSVAYLDEKRAYEDELLHHWFS